MTTKVSFRLDDQLAAAAVAASGGNLSAYMVRALRHELMRDELAALRADPRHAAAERELADEHDAAVDAYLRDLGR